MIMFTLRPTAFYRSLTDNAVTNTAGKYPFPLNLSYWAL